MDVSFTKGSGQGGQGQGPGVILTPIQAFANPTGCYPST